MVIILLIICLLFLILMGKTIKEDIILQKKQKELFQIPDEYTLKRNKRGKRRTK
jgi:competence protein ComGC